MSVAEERLKMLWIQMQDKLVLCEEMEGLPKILIILELVEQSDVQVV